MKKTLLKSIARNSFLTNLSAFIGICGLIGLITFPFLGFTFVAFLCAVLVPISFVFMNEYEANLFSDLRKAKEELGLSIFTSDKALLKKCLSVYNLQGQK